MNNFELYKLYSDENHKYNSIIWQFPTALVALNLLAFEKLILHVPTKPVILGVLGFNAVMITFLGKHVYHQGCFTKALAKIATRLKEEHGLLVVDIGAEDKKWYKGLSLLKKLRASLWLVRILFVANLLIYGCLYLRSDQLKEYKDDALNISELLSF